MGRATSATAAGKDGSILAKLAYAYDQNSNPTSITDQAGNASAFTYDALDRLSREAHPQKTLSYTYDAAGNRKTMSEGNATTSYDYDAAERMTGAGSDSFSYDNNGNMTSRTSGGSTTTYAYDPKDWLIRAGNKTYQRDARGRVVSSTEGGVATEYLHDGAQVIQEKTGRSAATRYSRGLGGRLISTKSGTGGAPSYYHHDPIGSVVGLSDNTGVLTDSYSYDAFGNELSKTGQSTQPYRYLGNRYEQSTGLYDSHARHYDAKNGRFVSKDPIKGSPRKPQTLNPYACSLNNPLRFPDPSGLYPQELSGEFNGPQEGPSDEYYVGEVGYEGECSGYVPENAQVPSEEDPYVPNPDREGPVQENIKAAELAYYLPGPGDAYFANEVRPYGEQDYKSYIEKDEEDPLYQSYADYGNFNFGATGAALGYDQEYLQDAGGLDQEITGPREDLTFDERVEYYRDDYKQLDQPDDTAQIQAGYDYYNCLKESGF